MAELLKHEAKPSMAGYCYQFTRAITHLLSPQVREVSIETLDDVSYVDGRLVILEQDKHTTKDGKNVFSNRSKNLLGTLLFWLKGVCGNEIDVASTRFCMVSNSDIELKGFVKIIDAAKDVKAAEGVVKHILENAGESEHARELVTYVNEKEGRRSLLCELIANTSICVNEKEEDTIKLIEANMPAGFSAQGQFVYQTVLGWIVYRFGENVRKGQPTCILHKDFITEWQNIMFTIKRSSSRERMAHMITLTEEEKEGERGSTYVKQIEVVDHEEEAIGEAIVDYLKFRKEKLKLTDSGNVLEAHWIDYFAKLEEHWKGSRKKFIGPKTVFKDEVDMTAVGRKVMIDTLNPDYREYLAGEQTEQPYMTKGGCHMLSNDLRIGWHPDYLERLKGLDK